MLVATISLFLYLWVQVDCELNKYPSPLLFVKFNGNVHDHSGNNPDPTVGSSSSYTTGPFGDENGAIRFDGTTDSVLEWANGQDGPLDFGGGDVTWIAWIKNMGPEIAQIFGFFDIPSGHTGFEFWEWGSDASFYVRMAYDGGSPSYTAADTYPLDEWTQVAFTFQFSTGYQRLYKNGVLHYEATVTYSGPIVSTSSVVRMGQRHSTHDRKWNGAAACVQLYSVYMSYGEISKVAALCNPEYVALNPWPVPLGIWPLNEYFTTQDMKSEPYPSHATAHGAYLESLSPPGSKGGSYQLKGNINSYLEIDNALHKVSPLNGITYALWIFPTADVQSHPILQYEYGTEEAGTNNWATHLWVHPNANLYICNTQGCTSELAVLPYQWNFVVISHDFADDEVRFMSGDQIYTADLDSGFLELETDFADRIRIGTTFYDPDGRHGNARYSCAQVYDMPMTYEEMRELKTSCNTIKEALDGQPSGLSLMYPFNDQYKCRSIEPVSQQQGVENHECALVTGPRGRESEALRITKSTISGDRVLLSPVTTNSDFESELTQTSSFTLMFYIRLRSDQDMDAKLGFLKPDGSTPSDTWIELASTGALTLSAGGLGTSDTSTLSLNDTYLPDERDWVHLTITCNRRSARCYLFRNGSYIGESIEDGKKDWFVSTQLFVELSSQSPDASFVDLSCVQLYNKVLPQGDIALVKDRCSVLGDRLQPPLPVGFWPLDKVYNNREITGRSRDMVFSNVTLLDESPVSSIQGSAYFAPGKDFYAYIPNSPGTTVRHSFTVQVYLKINAPTETYVESFPFFHFDSEVVGRSSPLYIVEEGNGMATHVRLFDNVDSALNNYVGYRMPVNTDTWIRIGIVFDFKTGRLKQYINGALAAEQKMTRQKEHFAHTDIWIGKESNGNNAHGNVSMSCLQIYDTELSLEQMNKAAELCDHHSNSNFRRPEAATSGWTQQLTNSTISSRGKLHCMQLCVEDPECLALNYYSDSNSCEMSSLLISDTGISSFQNTGGHYLEKVHPLIAQSL